MMMIFLKSSWFVSFHWLFENTCDTFHWKNQAGVMHNVLLGLWRNAVLYLHGDVRKVDSQSEH